MESYYQTLVNAMSDELLNLPEKVKKVMAENLAHKEKSAYLRQKEVNKHNPMGMIDGLGQCTMRVDSTLYHRYRNNPTLQKEYGENPWRNPKFRKDIAQKHPELVPKTIKKTMVTIP